MGSVAKGIHDGCHVVADAIVELDYIRLGYAQVFGECSVTVYTHANAVLANVQLASTAVAAMAAGYMAFARHAIAHLDVLYARTNIGYNAYIFMSNGHRSLYCLLAPFVPLVDV